MNKYKTPLSVKLLCILLSGLTACSTAPPKDVWREVGSQQQSSVKQTEILDSWGPKANQANGADPEIAPGFLLTMHSIADSKLNGDYRVEFNGNLQLPYDVMVNTTGTTLRQLQEKLTDLYRPYFKGASEIDLKIKERRYWIDVRGLVQKPGRYMVDGESSLDQVIGLAEGTSKDEPPLYVRIQKGTKVFIFDLSQYYNQGEDHAQITGWFGGEIIFFQKERTTGLTERSNSGAYRQPVYMMGEVRKPGEYLINPGSDFLDSLTQAGGFTDRADLDDIQIIRRVGAKKRVYDFSWNDFQQAPAPAQGDIVFVHADNQTKFERHTGLFATLIGALASVVTAAVIVLAYNKGRV